MITLYSMPSSGNSYKVRLLLALLGRDCQIADVEYETEAMAQLKAGAPALLAVAAGLMVNLRMAIYSAALAPHLGAAPMWKRALATCSPCTAARYRGCVSCATGRPSASCTR